MVGTKGHRAIVIIPQTQALTLQHHLGDDIYHNSRMARLLGDLYRQGAAMDVDATILRIQQETPTVKSFLFDLGGVDLPFLPGQWLDLYVETGSSTAVGGFSITSPPLQRGTIELAVKKLPHGAAATYLHQRAKVGESFLIRGGSGNFHYDQNWDGPSVFIAGGIGITPLMSILRYVDQAGLNVDVLLLYCARTAAELVFYDELQGLAARNPRVRCVFTVTRPDQKKWDGRVGRIDEALLREQIPEMNSLFYLCGPPPMQDGLSSVLAGLGVAPSSIKVERWW